MPAKTKIEWCDYVSNTLRVRLKDDKDKGGHACVKVSEGCAHCWASSMNVRLGTGLEYTLPNLRKVMPFWDDFEETRLLNFKPKGPFKGERQRPILFMADMTDVFGGWVPNEFLKRVFGVIEYRQDIDFVLLTKRPERMYDFVADSVPLVNVFLGTSVENRQRASERWLPMERISARGWKTMVSYEPVLGPVDWSGWEFLDWLICGGESGNQARPMSPAWARSARDFCQANGIPFFFKQFGEFAPVTDLLARGMTTFKSRPVNVWGEMMVKIGRGLAGHLLDGEEWREVPEANPLPGLPPNARDSAAHLGEGAQL